MPLVEQARFLRVTMGDTIVKTTPDVRISASFDQLNRVCTFELAEQPSATPADGAAVLVELVDSTNGVAYDMFGGLVDGGPETESEPFGMSVRAVDQLSNLRIVRTGSDLNLTGMTPKEAKISIFDYCELDYDPDDIVVVDYELGALEPVKWLADGVTTAAQIITEIDRIFGLTTQTVGNNRIISFRYDLMPEDGVGLYRTLTKGASFDFQSHHRTRGSRNDLQTIWSVNGVSHPFNDDQCSDTPWAKSVHGTARVGRSRRVPESSDQSDLIQDEALAAEVVRRHMARTSGIADSGTATTVTSRNLHPGSKMGIYDPTYGVRALPRYYCVTSVEITGLRTDLTLVAGPPGDEGTVTSGVDRVCNETHTAGDNPGDFTPPDLGFPPLDGGTLGDFPFPDLDLGILEPVNTTDPFINCESSGEAVDLLNSPWREQGQITWRYDAGLDETLGVYTLTEGYLFYNTTPPPTAKISDNDVQFGTGEVVCVSGTVKFCNYADSFDEGATFPPHLLISLLSGGTGGSAAYPTLAFYATPGTQDPIYNHRFGVSGTSEWQPFLFDTRVGDHMCVPLPEGAGGYKNTGGFQGSGVDWETESAFSVCFGHNEQPQRVYFSGDFGSGYHEDLTCPPGSEGDACEHEYHKVWISLIGSGTVSDVACPWVEITSLNLGFGTCEPNPEYIDPSTVDEGD